MSNRSEDCSMRRARIVPEDLRGFEWFHLNRLCHGDEATLAGHVGGVEGLAVGDSGRILASSGEDRTIKVWDIPGRKLLRTLEPIDATSITIALTPMDGVWPPARTTVSSGSGTYEPAQWCEDIGGTRDWCWTSR